MKQHRFFFLLSTIVALNITLIMITRFGYCCTVNAIMQARPAGVQQESAARGQEESSRRIAQDSFLLRPCGHPATAQTIVTLGSYLDAKTMRFGEKIYHNSPPPPPVSIRIRNGPPSQKGCVVNGQKIKASNK